MQLFPQVCKKLDCDWESRESSEITRDEITFFIKWAVDILEPFVKSLDTSGGRSIYDPDSLFRKRGAPKTVHKFRDIGNDRLLCSVALALDETVLPDLEQIFSLRKPVAFLTCESFYESLVDSLKGGRYLRECEPNVVHIHAKTITERFCWVLIGFETPAPVMVAMSPKHYVVGAADEKVYAQSSRQSGRKMQPPVFKLIDGSRKISTMRCAVEVFEVRALAEYISSCLEESKEEEKVRKSQLSREELGPFGVLPFAERADLIINPTPGMSEKDYISLMKSLYSDFNAHTEHKNPNEKCSQFLQKSSQTVRSIAPGSANNVCVDAPLHEVCLSNTTHNENVFAEAPQRKVSTSSSDSSSSSSSSSRSSSSSSSSGGRSSFFFNTSTQMQHAHTRKTRQCRLSTAREEGCGVSCGRASTIGIPRPRR